MNMPEGWIIPDWPVPAPVRALITTRPGGASTGPYSGWNFGEHVGDDPTAVARNREALRRLLPQEPVWLRQVHGTRVVAAKTEQRGAEADAAVTREPGRVCAVLTADCLPVLLADMDGAVIGIAHAGWRGLAAGVIENAVAAMGVAASSLVAYLGPAIGGGAYEVGSDVLDAFVTGDSEAAFAFAPRGNGKYLADLALLARQRLRRLGCNSVHGGSMCTYVDSGRFYSFRREGSTGRMASLIWIDERGSDRKGSVGRGEPSA